MESTVSLRGTDIGLQVVSIFRSPQDPYHDSPRLCNGDRLLTKPPRMDVRTYGNLSRGLGHLQGVSSRVPAWYPKVVPDPKFETPNRNPQP